MIDFETEDSELQAATGLGFEAILAELGPALAEKLARLRERYRALASATTLSAPERLERERLDSLLASLHGPRGLLRQAGALIAVRERLGRLVALVPLCRTDAGAAVKLCREALILRTFSREQVARTEGSSTVALVESVAAVARAIARLHDFCLAAAVIDLQLGLYQKVRNLRVAAGVADTWPSPKNMGDVVSFVLERLSESAFVKSASTHYDSLCHAHAAALREELWETAERGYARQQLPATLRDVTELDLTLEALCARLTDPNVDGAERRLAIGELYALVATSRAQEALASVRETLAPLGELLRTGIDDRLQVAHRTMPFRGPTRNPAAIGTPVP